MTPGMSFGRGAPHKRLASRTLTQRVPMSGDTFPTGVPWVTFAALTWMYGCSDSGNSRGTGTSGLGASGAGVSQSGAPSGIGVSGAPESGASAGDIGTGAAGSGTVSSGGIRRFHANAGGDGSPVAARAPAALRGGRNPRGVEVRAPRAGDSPNDGPFRTRPE